jgi:hypothetical protein
MRIRAVNVLISGGFTGGYEQLLPEFERISCLGVCFRDNQEKWNGAARDLELVKFV